MQNYTRELDWINAVLHNDEASTDQELIRYFVHNGLVLAEAKRFVAQRRQCLLDMFYYAV